MRKTIPAISIIIPMYNAEKYISECLDSIFAQTFTDFEIIIVDDCSTDESCAIVENYIKTHTGGGENLKLIRSEKNSGGYAGIPRNKGLRFSVGKYIYFFDSDDAIVNDALEMLYNTAEKFDADVVHSDNRYNVPTENFSDSLTKINALSKDNANLSDAPKIITNDLTERLKLINAGKMHWEPWTHFIRRDLLMEYNLTFPRLMIAEDLAFTVALACIAKKFVSTPKAFYLFRHHLDSNSRKANSAEVTLHKRGGDVLRGIKFFEDFSDDIDYFKTHPEAKYLAFEILTRKEILVSLYAQVPAYLLDKLVRKELDEIGNSSVVTAFLFARMHILNVNLNRQGAIIQQQNSKINDLQRRLESST